MLVLEQGLQGTLGLLQRDRSGPSLDDPSAWLACQINDPCIKNYQLSIEFPDNKAKKAIRLNLIRESTRMQGRNVLALLLPGVA